MSKVYIVLDETEKKWVSMTRDMICAVQDARQYHDLTKNEIFIYHADLVGHIQEEEILI